MQVNKSLWKHQDDAVSHMLQRDGSWVMADMGTGKSLMTLALAAEMAAKLTLIFTTKKALVNVWPLQIEDHLSGVYDIIAPYGSVASRVSTIQERLVAGKDKRPQFVVVNYQAAVLGGLKPLLLSLKPDLVIADESHKIKSHSAKATDLLYKIGLKTEKRIAMTGTPLPNGNIDAFGQMLFVDKTVFGTRFVPFRSRYAITVPISRDNPYAVRIVGYKNTEEFEYKIAPYSFRVSKDDVLDLPEYHHIPEYVYLSGKAATAYAEMRRYMVTDTGNGLLTASNVLVKALRLQEITSGHHDLHTEKLDILAELVESLGTEPVVIFAKFLHDIDMICAKLHHMETSWSILNGARDEFASWRGGNTQALVVQIDAGAESIDMTRSRYAIYYSNTYNLGTYEQSLARLHRAGQTRTVHYYHIIAKDTIDEVIYSALERKANMQQTVFDYIQGNSK